MGGVGGRSFSIEQSWRPAASVKRPAPDAVRKAGSALDAAQGNALDKEALREQEEDQNRQNGDDRAGHHVLPLGGSKHLIPELRQTNRDRQQLLVLQHDERPEKVVPTAQEDKDTNGGQRGLRKREKNTPVNTKVATSIDLGRIFELCRHSQVELAK